MASRSKSKIYFFFKNTKTQISNKASLKHFIECLFKNEKKKLDSLNYIFCSDLYLLKMNQQYLNHDFYTDILTFDYSESHVVQAEVYISVDRVKENAKVLNVSFKSELHRVIFHGALHLCGYSDATDSQKKLIRKKENYYLSEFFSK